MKNCLLSLLVVWVCCQQSAAQKKPDWVLNPPPSNDYFTGINFSSKSEQDYIGQAKSKALKDLSSQIVVTINSQTFLKTTEINNEVKQTFEENIKTSVRRDLEGYEQVDTWQDKNEYWVYYRLSKTAYYALRKQKFETALKSASESYAKAQQAELTGDYPQAIQLYIISTKPLEPFLGETFDGDLKNKSSEIMIGSMTAINSILANCKVVALNKSISIKAGSTTNENLNCKVIFNNAGKENVLRNFPLKYITEKGMIDLSSRRSISNKDGLCHTILTSCSSADKKASVRVSIDLDEIIKDYADDVLLCKTLKNRSCSYDMFMIDLRSPSIFFASDEKNLSKKLQVKVLEPAMKDLFKEMGFTFVPLMKDADYVVNIDSDTRQGGQAFDLSVAFLDVNILISDNARKEQVYSKQFANIKGVKQDHIAAGNEAYRKVLSTNFKNELATELKEKFRLKESQ